MIMTMIQAINQALAQEMERDDRIIVLGQDVGRNGGVFRTTEGLFDRFGPERVMDTPLAESGIIGASIGMTALGLRPVPRSSSWDSSTRPSTRSSPTSPVSGIGHAAGSPCP
jgi:pyruvate/2-oxoglutarate/acetoin dehydrogenase E1 component